MSVHQLVCQLLLGSIVDYTWGGGVGTNGVPWFKWPEFLSAIVVIDGLFVLLGMKKLGSDVKFGLP